jgi:hypothetical protein
MWLPNCKFYFDSSTRCTSSHLQWQQQESWSMHWSEHPSCPNPSSPQRTGESWWDLVSTHRTNSVPSTDFSDRTWTSSLYSLHLALNYICSCYSVFTCKKRELYDLIKIKAVWDVMQYSLVSVYQIAWCHISEDCNINIQHCKNLRSLTVSCF